MARTSATKQAEIDSAIVQVPVRMTKLERDLLRSLASQEDRTMQTIIIRALREKYPEFAELAQ